MKTPLTIEDLKNRVGKPIFVMATKEEFKHRTAWHILSKINTFKLDNESNGYVEFTDCKCIKFENIQFFRFFDTEVSEMELKEILDAEEKAKKKTGYERVEKGEFYYAISSLKEVMSFSDGNFSDGNFLECNTKKRLEVASYFNDENLAKNIARAERLKYQLRRYAALNGGIPSKDDWNDCEIFKYSVACNYKKNEIYATYISTQRDSFQIYFKDIKACKKAIETFKEELTWYFTEFEEQLY